MNPRIILYAAVGGFLTFYEIGLYFEGQPYWGISLVIIGIMNGIQMIRLAMLSEDRKN